MAPFLAPECLQAIFKLLNDDMKTLHSCLLVNRYWCSCVVPLLWSQPFELLTRPSSKLIETYSKFFDNECKKILSSHRIIIYPALKPSLFDYPRFIKSLRYHNIYDFSSVWLQEGQCKGLQKSFTGFETTNMIRVFVKELFKLFFNKNCVVGEISFNVIRFFDIPELCGSRLISRFRPYRDPSYIKRALEYLSLFENDLIEILSYEGCTDSLRNLQKLECGANRNDGVIMDTFRNLTKNLDGLEFNFASELRINNELEDSKLTRMMKNLIQEQRCLKKVSIRYGSQHIPELTMALNHHVNNLTELSFNKVDFNVVPFAETTFTTVSLCENLEKLVISECQGLTNDVISPLNNATFKNLHTLIFTKVHNPIDEIFRAFITGMPHPINSNQATLEPLTNLIASTNGNLKVLRLGRSLLYSRDLPHDFGWATNFPSENIMNTVSLTCHSLTTFEIHIRRKILPQVFKLLESTFQLNRFKFSGELDLVDDQYFWRTLSSILPSSLKDLTISIGPIFWLIVLHWLFENMKCKLEILQFPLSAFIDDEYLCIITQYAKLMGGSLKRLALPNGNKITQEGLTKALLVIENITNTGEYNK